MQALWLLTPSLNLWLLTCCFILFSILFLEAYPTLYGFMSFSPEYIHNLCVWSLRWGCRPRNWKLLPLDSFCFLLRSWKTSWVKNTSSGLCSFWAFFLFLWSEVHLLCFLLFGGHQTLITSGGVWGFALIFEITLEADFQQHVWKVYFKLKKNVL